MWCIPPQEDAAFVAQMEQVLEVYKRPLDSQHPVVCMDEQHKQLIEEVAKPLPRQPGRVERVDCEYVRHGSCVVWMFVEPLAGWRQVTVTAQRTGVDWALQVQALVDHPRYAEAERITLVCDNLNTHSLASLYQTFSPAEALRIAQRIELVHTPKHGSWLNISESELSVLTRQCLSRRLATQALIAAEATIWNARRNATQVGVDWQFRTADARIKLKRLYPKVQT
jgi:hypothetical protein